MATLKHPNGARHFAYCVVVVLSVALGILAGWQRRMNTSFREETARLQGKLSALEEVQAENVLLQGQRDRLLQSQEAGGRPVVLEVARKDSLTSVAATPLDWPQ